MGSKQVKFSATFKDEAVKMVIENSRPIVEVARELSINPGLRT